MAIRPYDEMTTRLPDEETSTDPLATTRSAMSLPDTETETVTVRSGIEMMIRTIEAPIERAAEIMAPPVVTMAPVGPTTVLLAVGIGEPVETTERIIPLRETENLDMIAEGVDRVDMKGQEGAQVEVESEVFLRKDIIVGLLQI